MSDHLESEGLKSSDEAWLVVDKDQWTEEQLRQLHQWSLQQANYGFALSNPKFEYWLLLHFERTVRASPPRATAQIASSAGFRITTRESAHVKIVVA